MMMGRGPEEGARRRGSRGGRQIAPRGVAARDGGRGDGASGTRAPRARSRGVSPGGRGAPKRAFLGSAPRAVSGTRRKRTRREGGARGGFDALSPLMTLSQNDRVGIAAGAWGFRGGRLGGGGRAARSAEADAPQSGPAIERRSIVAPRHRHLLVTRGCSGRATKPSRCVFFARPAERLVFVGASLPSRPHDARTRGSRASERRRRSFRKPPPRGARADARVRRDRGGGRGDGRDGTPRFGSKRCHHRRPRPARLGVVRLESPRVASPPRRFSSRSGRSLCRSRPAPRRRTTSTASARTSPCPRRSRG